jgi:platelet-activating factor acetylhydrolase
MVFSHGLGGTRNSYSHICASVASHGLVVVAPEHRDGSAPISYIRETPMVPDDSKSDQSDQSAKSSSSGAAAKQAVDYLVLPHRHGKDVEDGRNAQLKIRLWELGLMYEALLKMDSDAEGLTSLAQPERLSLFYGMLHLHEPGAVIWSGHSFGAATVIQFVKSIFYGHAVHNELDRSPVEGNQQQQGDQVQLFVPSDSCSLRQQVTPASPVVLLDPWALPLTGQSTRWLLDKPLPSYARTGSGGSNVIVILSEAFFKWRANIDHLKRALSPDPTSPLSSADGRRHARIFYPIGSAHPSQSDFGILFPWLTKKLCKAQEPERTLRLNVRAILQMLRENGVEVANTSRIDMEEPEVAEVAQTEAGAGANEKATDDWKILAPSGDVRGWVSIKLSEEMLEKEALANAGRGEA